MFLLDTNVVSELRRPKPHGGVVAWLQSVPDEQLHLASMTLGELQAGVEALRARDSAKAAAIEAWIDQIATTWNILPADGPVFREWARLMHNRANRLLEDGLIAATAATHGLTVVTRNVKDFSSFDVKVFNPFGGKSRTPA